MDYTDSIHDAVLFPELYEIIGCNSLLRYQNLWKKSKHNIGRLLKTTGTYCEVRRRSSTPTKIVKAADVYLI